MTIARSPPPEPGAGAAAAQAIELVQADPRRAARVASTALEQARSARDPAATSTAERALGLAARELGDVPAAVSHLKRAVRIAERASLSQRAAEARMSLCSVLAYRGDTAGALRQADLAAAVLRGADAARVEMQRAHVLQLLGRLDEALEGYGKALRWFRRRTDRLWEARCLNNRGVLHAYRGNLRAAEADLRRADQLCAELGLELAVADIRWNLGFVAARRGDVVSALALYDLADHYYLDHEVPRAHLLLDRCELFLSVRLIEEARQAAEQAVEELAGARRSLELAEARLMLSHAALLGGDAAAARVMAAHAGRAFARQRRPGWLALARYASLRAAWLGGSRSPGTLAAARRAAAALASTGWAVPALDARLLAARLALEQGRIEAAREELARASRARSSGPVELRTRAWHAAALLRLARGDGRGADAALRAGLTILDEHRAALGATELRAHVSSHGAELAGLGLALAVDSGSPERVLDWAERWRASALHLPPARPPDDAALAADLVELRGVVHDLDQAALSSRPTAALLRRQADLEQAIRRRSRLAPGRPGAPAEAALPVEQVVEALGDRSLLEIVQLDGQLHGVVAGTTSLALCPLGPLPEVQAELEALRFAVRRLAAGRGSPASLAAAADSAAYAAGRLDEMVLGPVGNHIGDGPLVIVPTGALHAMPWSLLPTCVGRPVEVAPSASLWRRAARAGAAAPGTDAGVVLVAGPGLAGAAQEVGALRRRYPHSACFLPDAASVQRVLEAMDGAALAHVAAHGRFRADNPLFSSLRLADGPLTVYDLERLGRAPRLFVLSACDSGLSAVHPGDELMGLASALFALGAATLIASVVPVPDAETRLLMIGLHQALRAGRAPAAALVAAQSRLAGPEPARLAAAAGFVCFGAG